jgi:class 3 adenylate cyclase
MASKLAETQLPKRFREVIDTEVDIFTSWRVVEEKESIPDTTEIPIVDPHKWLRIPDVICVFVDMVGSTRLSAELHDKSTAGAYQLFTGTAIRLFDAFDCPYIDVKGDGVFGLFNHSQPHTALAAAVSFKTFAREIFASMIKEKTKQEVGAHIGIDQRTVLVRKMGLKRYGGRTDRQNEVWAGKPVNMAAKLASLAGVNELLVSDRFFSQVRTDDHVTLSCGCQGGKYTGTKVSLWEEKDLSAESKFDFDKAHLLSTVWCESHGAEFCEAILKLDSRQSTSAMSGAGRL